VDSPPMFEVTNKGDVFIGDGPQLILDGEEVQ